MSAQAAQRLGFKVVVLDSDSECPAAQVTPHRVAGRFDNPLALMELANMCDVITLEHEWVNPEHFKALESAGTPVYPSAETLGYLTDKLIQRQRLSEHGLAGPEAQAITSLEETKALAAEWGYPIVL
jgi:5-(carboxyamino)imidazole ribonucleotide synthase